MATLDNNTNVSLETTKLQVYISLTIIFGTLGVHEFLRRTNSFRNLFTARCHLLQNKSPFPSNKPFGWIWSVWKIDEEFILNNIGLSAVVYLKFIKVVFQLLLFCLVLFLPILLPINYRTDETHVNEINRYLTTNLELGSEKYWIHAMCACAATLFALYLIDTSSIDIIHKKRREFKLRNIKHDISCRTVMITKLPKEINTEQTFKEYMQNLEIGKIINTQLLRRPQKLINKLSKRKQYLKELEINHIKLAKYFLKDISNNILKVSDFELFGNEHQFNKLVSIMKSKNKMEKGLPTIFNEKNQTWEILKSLNPRLLDSYQPMHRKKYKTGELILSIDYYLNKLKNIDKQIEQLREEGEIENRYPPSNTGFVVFSNAASAQQCAQSILSSDINTFKVVLSPQRKDILWPNHAIAGRYDFWRKVGIFLIVWALILFWVFPNFIIISLLSYDEIAKHSKSLKDFAEHNSWFLYLLKLVPTALLGAFQAILPHIQYYVSMIQPFKLYSSLERSVAVRYFSFNLFNTLLIFLIGRAFWEVFVASFSNSADKNLYILFSEKLSDGSVFFINYIILNISYQCSELIMLGMPLIKAVYSVTFPKSPRIRKAFESTWPFAFYYYMPQHMFIFLITIIYSILNPIILPVSFIYFAVVYFVFKHQFVYAYVSNFDAGTKYWKLIVRFFTDSLIFFNVSLICVLTLKQNVYTAIPSMAMILVVFYYKLRFFQLSRCFDFIPISILNESTDYIEDNENLSVNNHTSTFLSRITTRRRRNTSPINRAISITYYDNELVTNNYQNPLKLESNFKHPAFTKNIVCSMWLPSNPHLFYYDLYNDVVKVDFFLTSSIYRYCDNDDEKNSINSAAEDNNKDNIISDQASKAVTLNI